MAVTSPAHSMKVVDARTIWVQVLSCRKSGVIDVNVEKWIMDDNRF